MPDAGGSPPRPVTRADWKTQPLPERRAEIAPGRLAEIRYSAEEWERIRLGLRPRSMEDRWFIYVEGDRVYFHRSWTGGCILVADFEERHGERVLQRLLVNRDPEQYRGTDEDEDVRMVAELIALLMRKRG